MSNEIPHFKTRARILSQLGEQLIKSESIALMELIKNSYDADSKDCNIIFEDPENPISGKITITDHGDGMDLDIIKNVWLEIGTPNKDKQKKESVRSKKFNRLPLGEKGIGRLGVHRLGSQIQIITKTESSKECELRIDWDKISETEYIEDFPVIVEEHETPKVFSDSTGTKIIITKLRNSWTRGTIREIARSINSLSSPFDSEDSFKATISINNDWLDGLLTYEDIKDKSLYDFDIKLSGTSIIDFTYNFTPYETLDKVSSRHLTLDDIDIYKRLVDSDGDDIDISNYKIGDIRIKGRIFDLDNIILKVGITSGKKELKDYLKYNGGIKVFRDNMRIWNYGESDNDWLELDQKRINRPSYKLSNRLVLAAVYLDGSKSFDLIEKTNREGFLENDAYKTFKDACSYALDKIEMLRNQDKEKLRGMYSSLPKHEVPVLDTIEDVRELIKNEVKNDTVRKEVDRKLTRISEDYTRITDNLLKSAGAGLNLIAVLHQIDKLLKNLKSMVKNSNQNENLISTVDKLSDLVTGYSLLIKNSGSKRQPVNKLIDYAIDNTQFRFKFHKISLVTPYKDKIDEALCSENYMINALMNLFDNSIWWLGYSKRENSKIYIDISNALDNYVSVIVADNGPGFGIMTDEELKAPFVSAKPAGLGMGIGLHLTNEIMEALGGKLLFPEPEDFVIPEEFKKGAIVVLAFKRK